MEYVNLGSTGLKVSRICLGTMTYGSKKWREWVLEDTSFTQYQNPIYLRLTRSGAAYMASYSTDGTHWTQATSFTDAGAFTFIGPFDSNYNSSPEKAVPVVMSVDWFNVE
jgi:hypothetical protein